ncbi:type II toxin-antitoxin system TacA family antitoxin [Ancrocorticia populi]|uniref:type II toxin-antitoxin system TacA family antitoxin n=1 Tax=Ancrocorticia populi TaxID=2175228 RepID=UPI003F9C0581
MSTSAKDSRIALRTSNETKTRLKEAARKTDQDLSSFILDAANSRARQVLMEEQIMRLSDRDFKLVEEMIANPPEPNEALRELVRKHAQND